MTKSLPDSLKPAHLIEVVVRKFSKSKRPILKVFIPTRNKCDELSIEIKRLFPGLEFEYLDGLGGTEFLHGGPEFLNVAELNE